MLKKFAWGGANDENVNLDYNHRRTLTVVKARLQYARLAKELAAEGKKEQALEVLDYCMNALPVSNVPYDPYMPDLIEAYFVAGNIEKAHEMTKAYSDHNYEQLDYYLKQSPYIIKSAEYEIQSAIQYTSKVSSACKEYGDKELAAEIDKKLEAYYRIYLGMQIPEVNQ